MRPDGRERNQRPREIKHVSSEKYLSVYPDLYVAFADVSGVLHQTVTTCKDYADRTGDAATYADLTRFETGLELVTHYPHETGVFAVRPEGQKKYPRRLVLRTTKDEDSQAIVIETEKPRNKTLKGRVNVVLGTVLPGGEIREQAGVALEKVGRARQTTYRRKRMQEMVVQPSCLSVTEEGGYKKSTVNAYVELVPEFDALYDLVSEVYEESMK